MAQNDRCKWREEKLSNLKSLTQWHHTNSIERLMSINNRLLRGILVSYFSQNWDLGLNDMTTGKTDTSFSFMSTLKITRWPFKELFLEIVKWSKRVENKDNGKKTKTWVIFSQSFVLQVIISSLDLTPTLNFVALWTFLPLSCKLFHSIPTRFHLKFWSLYFGENTMIITIAF